jgi:hypothetical protein
MFRVEESMLKRLLAVIILSAVLLSACAPAPTAAAPVVVVVTGETPPVAATTPEPQVIFITATPDAQLTADANASTSAVSAPSTSTPIPEGITITEIEQLGFGRVKVHWVANGDFPSGFQVVFSSDHEDPTFQNDRHTYAQDPSARAAIISGDFDKIYYVRVCRYIGNDCDSYSTHGIFAVLPATATPTIYFITHTPTKKVYVSSGGGGGGGGGATTVPTSSFNAAGTPISSSNFIAITSMSDAQPGKAFMQWTATGEYPKGFKIVYSTTHQVPTYEADSFYAIADDDARTAYVDGTKGATYYYRVCRWTGSTCDIYSNVYKFTYAGTLIITATKTLTPTTDASTMTISNFTDTGVGQALIEWTITGTFPEGFRVLYSIPNNPPTMSDIVVPASAIARSATVYGIPGMPYYFRICKVVSGACTKYSAVQSYAFAPEMTLSFTDGVGLVTLNWTAPSVDPSDGYMVVRSDGSADIYEDGLDIADLGVVTTYDDASIGASGSTYNYIVCAIDGGDLSSCTDPETYTVP